MKTDIWMPLYVGDYLAGTQSLDAEESGCYLHLLMCSWLDGPLPNDRKKLMRMARLHGDAKQVVLDEILGGYFVLTDAGYIHKRLEKEREKAKLRSEAARDNGLKGGRPKKLQLSNGKAIASDQQSDGLADRKLNESSPPPPPHSSISTSSEKREGENRKRFTPPTIEEVQEYGTSYLKRRFKEAEMFLDFYASKGWKVGSTSMKDWKAAVRNWIRRDETISQPDHDKAISAGMKKRSAEVASFKKDESYSPQVMEAVMAGIKK